MLNSMLQKIFWIMNQTENILKTNIHNLLEKHLNKQFAFENASKQTNKPIRYMRYFYRNWMCFTPEDGFAWKFDWYTLLTFLSIMTHNQA